MNKKCFFVFVCLVFMGLGNVFSMHPAWPGDASIVVGSDEVGKVARCGEELRGPEVRFFFRKKKVSRRKAKGVVGRGAVANGRIFKRKDLNGSCISATHKFIIVSGLNKDRMPPSSEDKIRIDWKDPVPVSENVVVLYDNLMTDCSRSNREKNQTAFIDTIGRSRSRLEKNIEKYEFRSLLTTYDNEQLTSFFWGTGICETVGFYKSIFEEMKRGFDESCEKLLPGWKRHEKSALKKVYNAVDEVVNTLGDLSRERKSSSDFGTVRSLLCFSYFGTDSDNYNDKKILEVISGFEKTSLLPLAVIIGRILCHLARGDRVIFLQWEKYNPIFDEVMKELGFDLKLQNCIGPPVDSKEMACVVVKKMCRVCSYCGRSDAKKMCSNCMWASYCDNKCSSNDKKHSALCKGLQEGKIE